MAKFNRIKAPDIVPGQIYMAQATSGYGKWEPVSVRCTEDTGWLRGHVDVIYPKQRFGGLFIAEVVTETLYSKKTIVVHVERIGDNPWEFVDNRYATLRELDVNWVESECQRLAAEAEAVTKRLEFLKNLKN